MGGIGRTKRRRIARRVRRVKVPRSKRDFVAKKIKKLKEEGVGQEQAVAIALEMSRKKKMRSVT